MEYKRNGYCHRPFLLTQTTRRKERIMDDTQQTANTCLPSIC